MNAKDLQKFEVDRGLMTEAQEESFWEDYRVYNKLPNYTDGKPTDKSEIAPFFGKPSLCFHGRKHDYIAFKPSSFWDLMYTISTSEPRLTTWPNRPLKPVSLVVTQPHEGVFFALVRRPVPLGNQGCSILKLLSSHTEIMSYYSMSNDDPCSYQIWRDGKCVRAIEWIPHHETYGRQVDIGTPRKDDPIYEDRIWYMDVNRALEKRGFAGHRIPPLKSKDDEAYALEITLS